MQVYMSGIPRHMEELEVTAVLARYIHRPPITRRGALKVNFHVRLFAIKHFDCRSGLLTFPDAANATTFISQFGDRNGIPFEKHSAYKVFFRPSTSEVDKVLLTRLKEHEWQDPKELLAAAARRERRSAEIPLASYSFGRLCRDGVFSLEVRGKQGCSISCDMNNHRIRLSTQRGKIAAWYRANQILEICHVDERQVLIEASVYPVFEEPSVDGKGQAQRVESIRQDEAIPPVGRFLYLRFEEPADVAVFLNRCRSNGMRHQTKRSITFQKRRLFAEGATIRYEDMLSTLSFPLAFELEKAVLSGVLDYREVQELKGAISDESPDALRWFMDRIPAPSLRIFDTMSLRHARKNFASVLVRKNHRRQRGKVGRERERRRQRVAEDDNSLTDPTFLELFELAKVKYTATSSTDIRNKFLIQSNLADSLYQCYHAIVTPSSIVLEGPLPDQSSTILRRFGNYDSFLRVTFQDDNRVPLRQEFSVKLSIEDLLRTRYMQLLVHGFTVAGRHFDFLGYSMSGLNQHSLCFVNPFEWDGRLMTAKVIRSTLGDFSKNLRRPALLAARWAQAFSATAPSVTLKPEEVKRVPDIRSSEGSIFTDGCSTISSRLSRDIWARYRRHIGVAESGMCPSAFQIRVGGAKVGSASHRKHR